MFNGSLNLNIGTHKVSAYSNGMYNSRMVESAQYYAYLFQAKPCH